MPKFLTVSPSPHIKSPETTTTVMLEVIIALLPAFIWGVYIFGWRALVLGVLSIGSCVAFEALTQKMLHRPITVKDLSAAVTGLLLVMNLPVSVPLWMPIIGAFIAIVVVKQLFGGIGKNFLNPALAARVFLFSAWASNMSATSYTAPGNRINSLAWEMSDVVSSATPLAALKGGELPKIGLTDMVIGNIGGCIGEVSAVLLALGGLYLIIRHIITWHIPVAYIGTVALLTLVFARGDVSALSFMLYEVFAGGLMIGAFFMATDYATSPVTPRGRLLFGFGCGVITVMIRYFGSYPEGVSFAILIMNMLVWYIDKVTMPRRFGGNANGK
ncbi:MAG: RnfABCDGE type electron transport complex subunit D [Clostridia bacterium]|nr:RnfABCDGE type electron transport complex subunit D [Clostridia bacterium]